MNYQYKSTYSKYCRDCNGNLKHIRQAEEQNKTHSHNGCGCGKDLCLFAWGIMAQTTQKRSY